MGRSATKVCGALRSEGSLDGRRCRHVQASRKRAQRSVVTNRRQYCKPDVERSHTLVGGGRCWEQRRSYSANTDAGCGPWAEGREAPPREGRREREGRRTEGRLGGAPESSTPVPEAFGRRERWKKRKAKRKESEGGEEERGGGGPEAAPWFPRPPAVGSGRETWPRWKRVEG